MEYKEKFNNASGSLVSKEALPLIAILSITIFVGGGAVVGALISNDKKFGAIIGSIAGFTALGIKYISKTSINLRDNEIDAKANQPIRPSVPHLKEPKSQSDCGDGHEFIPRGGTRKKAFCQRLNIKPYFEG